MAYFDFLKKSPLITLMKGSNLKDIEDVENSLRFQLPDTVKEYLLLVGNSSLFYEYCDEHGTDALLKLREWLYEWINKYRSKGILLEELDNVLPFFNFQDTFFYVPINGNENPPVYAFDINDTPTIRKLNDSFTDFVKWKYDEKIKSLK